MGKLSGPFVIQEGMRMHGIDAKTRIAITDQTPSANVLCWILPEHAAEVVMMLNSLGHNSAEAGPSDPECEVHQYRMGDGHCTCAHTPRRFYRGLGKVDPALASLLDLPEVYQDSQGRLVCRYCYEISDGAAASCDQGCNFDVPKPVVYDGPVKRCQNPSCGRKFETLKKK